MEVAIDVSGVLVIRILGTKQSGTQRTCEVLHMEFLVCIAKLSEGEGLHNVGRTASSNVAPSQSQSAFGTNKIQSTEIVGLAQRLLLPFLAFDGEEFGCHDLAAILNETKDA
jgi:hypothetical protein